MTQGRFKTHLLQRNMTLSVLSADYLIAAFPLLLFSCWQNGARTLLLVAASALCAMLWEAIFEGLLRRRITIWDGSAACDGVLFALLLPSTLPLRLIPLSTLAMTLLFKVLWGGQGKCPVHPAIGAYALLYPFFRVVLTSYAAPMERLTVFSAQPIGSVSQTMLEQLASGTFPTEQTVRKMLIGDLPGCMGELSLILLVGAFLYLWMRGHIPPLLLPSSLLSALVTFILLPGQIIVSDAMAINYVALQLGCGSLVYLSVFLSSHPTCAPHTVRGQMIFGIGVGVITGLLRCFGCFADGAVYAVLIMQLTVPLLDRLFRPRHYAQT